MVYDFLGLCVSIWGLLVGVWLFILPLGFVLVDVLVLLWGSVFCGLLVLVCVDACDSGAVFYLLWIVFVFGLICF